MTDDLERARQRREKRAPVRPVGSFEPSGRRQAAIDRAMAKVDEAAERRDPAAYYAGREPTPQRITLALNYCELYGPEVDRALGGEEPMVDEWESGARVPTLEQIQALADLTGYTVRFFYEPPPPVLWDGGWMCGAAGCKPLTQD